MAYIKHRSTLKHIGILCFNPVIVWKTGPKPGRLLHFIIHHQQKTCHQFYSLMPFISKILHTFPFLFADIEIRVVAYCVYTCTDTRQPLLLCCFFVHTKCSCSAVYIIFILRVQVRYRSEINIHWKSLIFTGNRFINLEEKYLLSVRSEVSFINLLWLTLNIVNFILFCLVQETCFQYFYTRSNLKFWPTALPIFSFIINFKGPFINLIW